MLLFGKTKIAQEFDKKSIKNGIPSIILMENAAFSLFEEVKKILQKNKFDKIVLFAGSGGNGGDGFALLRQLTNRGINIPNFIVKLFDESKFTEETKINFKMLPKSIKFISMEKITGKILFIDGMIGTGLSRNLSEKYLNAVKFINNYQKSQKQVLAIDVPTGLNSDNGKEMPLSIVANLTVSMGILKTGLFLNQGIENSGKIILGNISAHEKSFKTIKNFVAQNSDFSFKQSKLTDYKNKHGHLLIFAGDLTKIGATIISAKSFLASGGGLVTIAIKKEFIKFLAGQHPEIMLDSVENILKRINDFNIVVAGPGISKPNKETISFLEKFNKTIILDAGMIDFIASNNEFYEKMKDKKIIFTPHFGELKRFFKLKNKKIESEDFLETIKNFNIEKNQILFAKNASSFIKTQTSTIIIPFGAKSLAFGGSGDSLTGILASMLSRENNIVQASINAGLLHRQTGLELEKKYNADFHNILTLIKMIPIALNKLREKND
jgi:NAD(P)H-hydrate epimerase